MQKDDLVKFLYMLLS